MAQNKLMTSSVMVLVVLLIISSVVAVGFERIKFAVISDPHVSLPTKNTQDKVKMEDSSVLLLQQAIKEINSIPDLDFVLIAGDLTKDAEPWNIDLLVEMLEQFRVPVFCALGNHELSPIPNKDGDPSLASLIGNSKYTITWALQKFGFRGPQGYYSVDPVPGLHLVVLDTTKVGSWGGKVSQAQLEWLEKDLFANQDKLTIVMGHHLLVPFHEYETKPEWKNFYLDNAEEVIRLFEKYPQVCMYICGHRHVSTVPVEKNGIWYIEHISTLTYPMGYTVYTLTPTEFSYEVKWLNVAPELFEKAKETMLADPFWRPIGTPAGKEGDDVVLAYQEQRDYRIFKAALRFQPNKSQHQAAGK